MKQSDIEEYKAILYFAVGIFAYASDLLVMAIVFWVWGGICLLSSCVIRYYERKIEKLKRELEQNANHHHQSL